MGKTGLFDGEKSKAKAFWYLPLEIYILFECKIGLFML